MQLGLYLVLPRKCDLKTCQEVDTAYIVLNGCGHSFHPQCMKDGSCLICSQLLQSAILKLVRIANDAIFRQEVDDDTQQHSKPAKTSTSQDDPTQDDLVSCSSVEERDHDSTIKMMNDSILGWEMSSKPKN